MKISKTAAMVAAAGLIVSTAVFPVSADTVTAEPRYTSTPTLFCGDPIGERVYNYCPSAIYYGDSIYVYFAANSTEGVVTDSIYLNRLDVDGEIVTYTDKKLMLSPSEEGWDDVHVCDPSVIGGSFAYNGKSYGYLMAYLGCDRKDNQHNQIGLAVSEDLDGEWVKVEEINPIITAEYDRSLDSSVFQWGAGQPSVVSVDKKGTVAIFYTRNDNVSTFTMCEVWDLSDIGNPKKMSEFRVSNDGTENGNGKPETLSNADFAYNCGSGTMYMITDQHPFNEYPTIIADSSDVYEVEIGDLSNISSLSDCTWKKSDTIGYEKTGSLKNHNTGFLRTVGGKLYTNAVLYTSADESLWSYRIGITRFESEGMASTEEDEQQNADITEAEEPSEPAVEPETTEPAPDPDEGEITDNNVADLIPPASDTNKPAAEDQDTEPDDIMNTGVEDYTGIFIAIGTIAAALAAVSSLVGLRKETS